MAQIELTSVCLNCADRSSCRMRMIIAKLPEKDKTCEYHVMDKIIELVYNRQHELTKE